MRSQRPLILLLAGDIVELRHLLGRLSHRLARGWLGDGRRDRNEILRAHARERADARRHRLRARGGDEHVREAARVQDRNVRQRLGAARHRDVDVPEHDLIGGVGDRLVGRGAGAAHRHRGDPLGELRQERHLARDVRFCDLRHHRPEDDGLDLVPVEIGPLHELGHAESAEVGGRHASEAGAGAREGGADPCHDGHAAPVAVGAHTLK